MAAITRAHTFTTISDMKYLLVKRWVTSLRRSTAPTLWELAQEYTVAEGTTLPNSEDKGALITFILEQEFGALAVEAYNNEKTARMARKARSRRRGQLVLGL